MTSLKTPFNLITRPWAGLLLLSVLAACECGGPKTGLIDNTTVTFVSPAAGSMLPLGEATSLEVIAENPSGLQSVILLVGQRELLACPVDPNDDQLIGCKAPFEPSTYADQIRNGELVLTAKVQDASGHEVVDSIRVRVPSISVSFVSPAPQGDGVIVDVTGRSALTLAATGPSPVESVSVVVVNDGRTLATFTAEPYSRQVAWFDELGAGEFELLAMAEDRTGASADARLRIRVGQPPCTSDAQCAAGTRCCVNTGTCNPIVGSGELCDCERPCPEDEGCFPGTCGQSPRRCRPGCFPGSDTVRADRCAPQDGRPAYCSKLPESEQTVENEGGACAPADQCDIYAQNCPNLPIDRSRPAGPDNPAVPHSCVPVSPVANACYPAGPIALNQTGCDDLCGADGVSANCARGGLCVQSINPTTGQPIGAKYCSKMCTSPHQSNASAECGGKRCLPLVGSGREPYPMGACEKF